MYIEEEDEEEDDEEHKNFFQNNEDDPLTQSMPAPNAIGAGLSYQLMQ